jgi:hypothetical protein
VQHTADFILISSDIVTVVFVLLTLDRTRLSTAERIVRNINVLSAGGFRFQLNTL